jgi:leucyl-tRNA synthetase
MNERYVPAEVEAAARAHWDARDAYRVHEDPKKKKFYACSMLPYPSGRLHMGHVRNYTINDMLARYKRMQGFNVLMPMGWDAFGLPAENAAMKSNVAPAAWTYENIRMMKSQCQALGLAIDWSRELASRPGLLQGNQWFFLKMPSRASPLQDAGRQLGSVDQTVLANEQVIDGHGWRPRRWKSARSGLLPQHHALRRRFFECTLHGSSGWSDRVRLIQENWIGKSFGPTSAFHTRSR